MSVARLYADENFPLQAVEKLRELGWDVLTMREDGLANLALADDAELFRALELERAIITLNRRDFIRLHREVGRHAGIVVCSEDFDTAAQAERIDRALRELPSVERQLIRVHRPARGPT